MAVTSIWPIKGRVDKVINYARNPEKTHDKKSLLKLHEIEGVIEYAADEMKTETRALVTCLNLSSEENAAKEFMEVKHRYPVRTHRRLLLSLLDDRKRRTAYAHKIRKNEGKIFEGA